MPLPVFDTLRADRPQSQRELDLLESAVVSMLTDDPTAVVHDSVLTQTLHLQKKLLREILVDLVKRGFLEVRVFWKCPNGYGIADARPHVKDFPDVIICSQCGEEHWLSEADLDAQFIATDRLLQQLHT
jgi:hypothetical protein